MFTETCTRAGKVTLICLACNPSVKYNFMHRWEGSKFLARHLCGARHLKNAKAYSGPATKPKKPVLQHCMGLQLYPLADGEEPAYEIQRYLDTMIRYIPHNVDSEILLSETTPGTEGLRVRAHRCHGKGEVAPCRPCIQAGGSTHMIRAAVRFVSKLDALLWYETIADGASPEMRSHLQDALRVRDYVVGNRGS